MFSGKYALVTGSNRGIGHAFLTEFAKNGCHLVAHARRETPEFLSMLESIKRAYEVEVVPVYFDMENIVEMKSAIRSLLQSQIFVSILINNAGIAHGGLFQMTSMNEVRNIFNINLFAQMELTQLLLRPMIKKNDGCIINMSSIMGIELRRGNCAYGVSKSAMIAFTKTLAAECGEFGVRVNAIAPGLIDTDMARLMKNDNGKQMIASSAMNRLGMPEEVAKTAVFLASESSSFINGQVIRVDGGSV